MTLARDLTRWRWVALALSALALILMIAPTLPYVTAFQDPETQEILTRTDHLSWFNPLVVGGGANFAAWLAIVAVLAAAVTTVLAAVRARAARPAPYRSPMVLGVLATALAVIALLFAGGQSLWGWVAVVLLAAASVANYLPTRPAGRPLIAG